MQKKGEECKCDKCPDDSLQRLTQKIKCPCKCVDGKEREMEKDSSCDCSCTCADGSKDTSDKDGKCPCECECKNCEKSTKGPAGCKCPNDVCPVCKSGAIPEWVGCECKCPDEPCGVPPTCVTGRRGPKCEQPDCGICQGCSGNGICTAAFHSCSSRCRCNPRWRGACCEDRVPRRGWGDPHLETLDGVSFDYFGIGQFWDCKSEDNDFGFQVRYFYYKQTSFTGAMAIKAGLSVVTITTHSPANKNDKPTVRIDGKAASLDKNRSKVTLSNATVLLDIQSKLPNASGSEESAVLLLSIEYKSGATVTVDTRYSLKMKRQYLNIQFTPTKAFKHKTTGLCGIMDDDRTNDLTGPNGTLYKDTTLFVESWRITMPVRSNGGLFGSWSWTESNFHKDDTMDPSYNDPTYSPSYSIAAFSQNEIVTATRICKSKRITGALLDGCIYDVVITNDTSLAQQEALQIGCPNDCYGKGRCANKTCLCLVGWSGADCHIGACGNCSYGDCVSGFCQCQVGWEGAECNKKATCFNVNNCTDSRHGRCKTTDKCLCVDGFTGMDCSKVATCYQRANCSGHGLCVDEDKCKCQRGWQGESCSQVSCEALQYCSGKGTCVGYDVCLCEPGWTGRSCSAPSCLAVKDCSSNGECVQPNLCKCQDGYTAADCGKTVSCPQLQDCSGHGLCIARKVQSANGSVTQMSCRCDSGFTGSNCGLVSCDQVNQCSGHGNCTDPNVCDCDKGYIGTTCSQFSCATKSRCSGHGNCTSFEVCSCYSDWSGESCDMANCSGVSFCSSQGQCVAPDTCECYDGFDGQACDLKLGPNVHSPTLNQSEYQLNITETEVKGKSLVWVHATDMDTGRNGEIRFSLDMKGTAFDVGKYIQVDSITGNIVLLKAIPRSLVPAGQFTITLVASDRGIPSKSDTATVTVNIQDVNDHCPSFKTPAQGRQLYVNSSTAVNTTVQVFQATDADFGPNGQIKYYYSSDVDATIRAQFRIDPVSGTLYSVITPLTVDDYRVSVVASDNGETPCSRAIAVNILVLPSNVMPPAITSRATTAITTTTITMTGKGTTETVSGKGTTETSKGTTETGKGTTETAAGKRTTETGKGTTEPSASDKPSETLSDTPTTHLLSVNTDVMTPSISMSPSVSTRSQDSRQAFGTSSTLNPPISKQQSDLPVIIFGTVLGSLVPIVIFVIIGLLCKLREYRHEVDGMKKRFLPVRGFTFWANQRV